MANDAYPADYVAGIHHFNERDFFEAHETWEDAWRVAPPDRVLYYKGLIHAAVALHHFVNGNLRGARKLYSSCLHYLGPYCPAYLGLDVRRLVEDMERCFAVLLARGLDSRVEIDPDLIPVLTLEPSPAAHGEEAV